MRPHLGFWIYKENWAEVLAPACGLDQHLQTGVTLGCDLAIFWRTRAAFWDLFPVILGPAILFGFGFVLKGWSWSWKQVPLTPASEIPHFKEVIIMATNCEYCGHRTNEVRAPLVGKTNLRVTCLIFTLLKSALG